MILFLSAYPPRECGLASYSYHLIQALKEHFDARSLAVEVCALEEAGAEKRLYPDDVRYTLNTEDVESCRKMAHTINADKAVQAVCIQHRFGMWGGNRWGENILHFLEELEKPLAVVFHNVLPEPETGLKELVSQISRKADLIIAQTKHHAELLIRQYHISREPQIRIIPPGAPVISPFTKEVLKAKHKLEGKIVISSNGYLRRSKGLEHVLEAVDRLRHDYPEIVYLILGETHPVAARLEGERYRIKLKDLIFRKNLQKHVRFVNRNLNQDELQEFMCLSDVVVHTSKNNFGSLVLAHSCGCSVVASDVPAIYELLGSEARLTNLNSAESLATALQEAIAEQQSMPDTRREVSANHPNVWPNIAMKYQEVFAELVPLHVHYKLPELKPDHLYRLTTSIGLLHLDQYDHLSLNQGYHLSDNAKALVASLLWYRYEPNQELLLLMLMRRFLNVIRKCQQADGYFLSRLDEQGDYVPEAVNSHSEISNMQALWALSTIIRQHEQLPADLPVMAQRLLTKALPHVSKVSSLKAIAFAIKALCQYNQVHQKEAVLAQIEKLADKLQAAFDQAATADRPWFAEDLSTENGILSEAMLLAAHACGREKYKKTAHASFTFLLSNLFAKAAMAAADTPDLSLTSEERFVYSNQPAELSQTILALDQFYQFTEEQLYLDKMYTAFSWFIGNNDLHQTLYNPATGGCFDGLRNGKLSQHQGAECLVNYLLSRLTLERYATKLRSQQEAPAQQEPAVAMGRGVDVIADRPSIPSGRIRVIAN